MLKRISFIAMAALLALGMGFADQSSQNVTLKADKTSPTSGKQMYSSYCAPCHGVDGRGNGPIAPVLKVPPTDLTLLTRNNNGRFPDAHIVTVLRNGTELRAHGTQEMPIWGPIFGKMNVTNPQEKLLRISNVSRYLETLQVK
jgi:mono/diheme cytochrome c family protein